MNLSKSLELHFIEADVLELVEVTFSHPLLREPLKSIRGKARIAAFTGSFQFTRAVRALCSVLLRTKCWKTIPANVQIPDPSLVGTKGTLATSLDYALAKQPMWLLDMFGVDSSGLPLAHRLFQRVNSCSKRPGPVMVSLNEGFLPSSNILLMKNNVVIEQYSEMTTMLHSIETPKLDLLGPMRDAA
jgi:hypothetical protein